jgi:formylglycine-generating enzyme required for sulfatase activity
MQGTFLEITGRRIEFVKIPPGRFQMGSVNELPFALETPVHDALIAHNFFVSGFLITQEQYEIVTGANPARFRHEKNLPVENVTWFEAKNFCRKLSEISGKMIRLPSETEWEYFARAGSTTEFFFGDDDSVLPEYAWFELNGEERTHPVGLKKPNHWGLFDVAGNVWEWCEDVWQNDYTDFPADGSANTRNYDKQRRRATRGGSFAMNAFRCRSSYRSFDWNDTATDKLGFRVVMEGI